MQNLRYVGKNLFLEKLSISNILKKNKTPFYLYSENQIINNYLKFTKTFKKTNPIVCFAAKSNSNVAILKILGKLGAGADVVSVGELLKALKAGIKSNKIVFSGVGKTEEELEIAINKKILLINCESESEAKLIDKIAKKLKKKVSIGFRLNPNIDAKTHKKISTGKAENKFGLSIKNFKSFFRDISMYQNIRLDALSVHIGSQILTDAPYKKTLNVMSKLIEELNLELKFVDLGGGFGINYSGKDKPINLTKYSALVDKFSKKLKCKIIFEPGRSIIGDTGILLSKIQYIKKSANKDFIILDVGMNDFMRPALYDAKHIIIPVSRVSSKIKGLIEFVGPICESTCKFGIYKNFSKIKENDYIAITNVGAYGSSLSSNYNTRPLIAEILVSKNKFKYIRKKQNLLKLINS
ncbi:diaminopimelate decarboxylase [Pelagibacteraceae bacterium]|nr:diaminopimelate decarboxylase [Pelagibacteraceae bacterium]MDB9742984.1 diaminopimelate decarboxylase [Pelagibacteraceae bacterium]MDC0339494.1 diaminopimelate decarboxylase [Pelagibacteraceae bacterium]MDC0366138.1 diaminopimelate decarboxylase [Pelagibacteraceae bacterium]|tara:strand:+ start:862 stop:2091 length:1230 start_codon:yes stop_codon:yes gene_type:complete